jgi:hypothetical protein
VNVAAKRSVSAAPATLVSTDIDDMVIVVAVKAPAGQIQHFNLLLGLGLGWNAGLQQQPWPQLRDNKLTPAPIEHLQRHSADMHRM